MDSPEINTTNEIHSRTIPGPLSGVVMTEAGLDLSRATVIHVPTEQRQEQSYPLTGVVMTEAGPDLSRAAHIRFPVAQGHDVSRQPSDPATNIHERQRQAQDRLAEVRAEAAAVGVDEAQLRSWLGMYSNKDKPHDQLPALQSVIKREGVEGLTVQQLRSLLLRYDKERTRSIAEGPIFHYHQTGMAGFEGAAEHRALLSSEAQMALGLTDKRSGSTRPDVVQFTRDEYGEKSGTLIKPGVTAGLTMGRGNGAVTLIFGESLMDEPEYDGAVHYPNLPAASFDHLAAVAVDNPDDIARARGILASAGMDGTPIVMRHEWVARYQPANSTTTNQ